MSEPSKIVIRSSDVHLVRAEGNGITFKHLRLSMPAGQYSYSVLVSTKDITIHVHPQYVMKGRVHAGLYLCGPAVTITDLRTNTSRKAKHVLIDRIKTSSIIRIFDSKDEAKALMKRMFSSPGVELQETEAKTTTLVQQTLVPAFAERARRGFDFKNMAMSFDKTNCVDFATRLAHALSEDFKRPEPEWIRRLASSLPHVRAAVERVYTATEERRRIATEALERKEGEEGADPEVLPPRLSVLGVGGHMFANLAPGSPAGVFGAAGGGKGDSSDDEGGEGGGEGSGEGSGSGEGGDGGGGGGGGGASAVRGGSPDAPPAPPTAFIPPAVEVATRGPPTAYGGEEDELLRVTVETAFLSALTVADFEGPDLPDEDYY